MFIKLAYNYLHDSWRYLVGLLVIFLIWQIGTAPFALVAMGKFMAEGGSLLELQEDQTVLMTILNSNLTLFLMLLSFAIGLAGIWLWAKYIHGQPMKTLTTTRKKIDWKRFWVGFGLIAITTIVTTYLDYSSHPENYELQFDAVPFVTLAIIAIVFIPLQTSFEEYFFRGYLMQGIGVSTHNRKFALFLAMIIFSIIAYLLFVKYTSFESIINTMFGVFLIGLIVVVLVSSVSGKLLDSTLYGKLKKILINKFTPLFITSLVFGLLHLANPEVDKLGPVIMVFYIGTGFFLGIITLMDEGMELALGFHAGNNLVAALLVTADWTAFQTNSVLKDISEPSAGFDILLPVLIVYPIFIGIMAWIYKWKGWKEKLFGKVTPPPKEDMPVTQ